MKKMKFYGSTTVGERGQIVLPISLRRELNITKGDTLVVIANPHIKSITLFSQDTMDQYLNYLSENITELRTNIKQKK